MPAVPSIPLSSAPIYAPEMSIGDGLFSERLTGSAGWLPTVVRLLSGAALVAVSLSKFTRHQQLVESFERYGVPAADISVYVAGVIELVGGVLLVLGLFTRVAALVVVVNMIVATATGGRVERDLYHLGLGPLLLVAAAFLMWSGAGRLSLDTRLFGRQLRSA